MNPIKQITVKYHKWSFSSHYYQHFIEIHLTVMSSHLYLEVASMIYNRIFNIKKKKNVFRLECIFNPSN